METNTVPHYDMSVNTTGCCPKFNPEGWDAQELHFRDKLFLRADTMSVMHVPLNMGRVFTRVQTHMEEAGAQDPDDLIVLSRDTSPWHGQHLFSASKPVENEAMTTLSGDFITKVFEGPYRKARNWYSRMQELVREKGREPGEIWFFYTTCPKCAKAYGKNYVVGVAEMT
ncbi:hydrolase [Antarctobacter jejuensis]|uniref:hydrolase n=1 Tax=Antarctobacter jejuensis TaxID=1439938 RepID=UPI003FD09523